MPIAALSENACRAIRSTLVLNDAISVIKELIDNALDSNASNIIIEISANTLDILQIKDNGAGIGVEDRQLLCKRGYTSKIRTFEDLVKLGGTFLGFRGEALASIAELSDNVTFTTRVDGETVGTLLKFNSDGKLVSSSSAAHGTGTTVRVSDFLRSIPVRRQTAVKQAAKTLGSIKRLLFDYAFARPTVRFQLKVLKSGSDLKANWSFVPCNDANNLSLLASKIVGKDVATNCKQASVTSEDRTFTIDGLLFDEDADILKCSGVDSFVSIDGRPLTFERGFMRELNKNYRSYIKGLLPEGSTMPKKLFMLLRLRCPRGCYDINIEPTKNEVMFENSQLILDLFEQLCKTTYGGKMSKPLPPKERLKKHTNLTPEFDLLLAKKGLPNLPGETQDSALLPQTSSEVAPTSLERAISDHPAIDLKNMQISRSMGDVDQQDLFELEANETDSPKRDEIDEAEEVIDLRVHNPFVLAKVNTRLKSQSSSTPVHRVLTSTIRRQSEQDNDTIEQEGNTYGLQLRSRRADLLPSPSPSPEKGEPYQNPGPPNRPWKTRRIRGEEEDDDDMPTPLSVQQKVQASRPTLIDQWAQSINSSSPQQSQPEIVEPMAHGSSSIEGSGAVSPRDIDEPNLSSTRSKADPRLGHQPAFQTPFKKVTIFQGSQTPVSVQHSGSRSINRTDGLVKPRFLASPARASDPSLPGIQRPEIPSNAELDEIMDFEHRKRSTILQHRGKARQQEIDNNPSKSGPTNQAQLFQVPARPENEGLLATDATTKYASRFGFDVDRKTGDIPPQPNSASYTQNPHWNRYRKALRDLEDRASDGSDGCSQEAANEQVKRNAREQKPKAHQAMLSPRDPRAYLIRHANDANQEGNTTKPKRPVTAKLPFEMIPSEVATFAYLRAAESGKALDCQRLLSHSKALNSIDPYVREGTISSELSIGVVSKSTVQKWEANLHRLLKTTSIMPPERLEHDPSQDSDDVMSAV